MSKPDRSIEESGAIPLHGPTKKPDRPGPPKFKPRPEKDRPSPAPSYIKRPEKR